MELLIIFGLVGCAGLYLAWNLKNSLKVKTVADKKCSGDCRGCSCGH